MLSYRQYSSTVLVWVFRPADHSTIREKEGDSGSGGENSFRYFTTVGTSAERGNSSHVCSSKTSFCKRVCGIKSDDSNRPQVVFVQVEKLGIELR